MINDNLIAVIIPVHNSASTIRAAIDSVIAQTHPSQIYLIDDASSDDLSSAIRPYMELPFFHLIVNETNKGVAQSRMKGVEAAENAEYIAFLDADDWWDENKLKEQLLLMQEKNAVLSSCGRELMDPEGKSTGRIIGIPETIDRHLILRTNPLNCSGVMVKRNVMLEYPMDHDDAHEDYISWIRIITSYGSAAGLDKPYLKYRLTPAGKSRNKLHSAAMHYRSYRYVGFSRIKSLSLMLSYAIYGIRKYYL
ncbi:MAG: glycosyltransferase family 2 protein [Lachnospiraceae bacterium]|nr:glycosyltransferase family 2 protein [Lachnospiraceae bacterium]